MDRLPIDYFRDEVRNGFFVPTAIKQAWGAQLKVLDVIDSICRKNNITYFADWGTLLGTVRHGGYVPWDDDMDICMKRADYEKFRRAAAKELPGNYCLHDYAHKEDHWLFLARVVNNTNISYEQKHMDEFYNFPYLVGIDIFVLDYLYRDDRDERRRCDEVKHIIAVADAIVNNKISKAAEDANLMELERLYNVKFNKNDDSRHLGIALYHLAETQMARVPEYESDSLGQIFPWILIGNRGRDKKLFKNIIRLPFENTTMPVPADYNYMLKSKYEQYFVIRKVWNGHKYPFFEAQRESLQAVADFKLPEFTFDIKKLRKNRPASSYRNTMQETVREAMSELCGIGEVPADASVLVQCQQAAIDIGSYIEKVKGEDNHSGRIAVASIEQYCEMLFRLYNAVTQPDNAGRRVTELQAYEEYVSALGDMKSAVQSQIIDRKLVAFVTDNPLRWQELQPLYDYYNNIDNTEAVVIPLPVLAKNLYGEVVSGREEWSNDRREEYPDGLNTVAWDSIDMHMLKFDTIIIQNPYDEWNPYITVPAAFYSAKLMQYTDCLTYVMPCGVNDFTEADVNDMYGLKYSLAMPGAVYADRIIVHSEKMKKLYAEYLGNFAAGTDEAEWYRKLVCDNELYQDTQSGIEVTQTAGRKRLLYCIGENEFAEGAGYALDNISKRISTMAGYTDKMDIIVCTYPYSIDDWDICTGEQKEKFRRIINDAEQSGNISLCDFRNVDISSMTAYYGSPSPLICRFTEQHKPVMISASERLE